LGERILKIFSENLKDKYVETFKYNSGIRVFIEMTKKILRGVLK